MNEKIKHYINLLEQEKDIKILLACETGSRAWGFPSPDSDFDIRMIYVHKRDWYISINEPKDSIERMFENNDIDISGWELRKALGLLRKSNASLLERIQSPIIYQSDEGFIEDILKVGQSQYSRIATIHHYLSMAKKFIAEMELSPEYRLKKFFYTLRSATVCKWIMEKETIPPIEFEKVYKNLSLDKKLVQRIEELIELKATKSESYMLSNEEELFAFIKQCISEAEALRQTLPSSSGTTEELNQFLRKYVAKHDH